jgi:hypothetical protein
VRIYLKIRVVTLFSLLGVLTATPTSWGGTELPPDPPNNCPKFADVPIKYEKPKTPGLSEALDHCLANLSQAQGELCALYAEGKVKRRQTIDNGPWTCITTTTNARFLLLFLSEASPLERLEKGWPSNDYSRSSEQYYRIEFDDRGRIQLYVGYKGRHVYESLSFHSNGGVRRFRADIGSRTAGEATWDADGKLQSEGLSPQLPKDAEGLPELEDVLRHGNDEKKTEAILAMMQIGIDSIPYALNVLKDGDELSRERAAFLFGLLAARAHPATSDTAHRLREEAVPALARLLREDKSAKVRGIIAQSLGSMGPAAEAAIPALEQAATNDVPEVANTAKASLGRIRGPSSK